MEDQDWSKKYKECQNCGTARFEHKGLGLCKRCYPLEKRLKHIDDWNLSDTTSLVGYPNESTFHTEELFPKIKKGFKRQIKQRLNHFRYIEDNLKGNISGHDLEYKIRRVANLSGINGDMYLYGTANIFNHYFDDQQKKEIYKLLNRITENVRWKGIDWWELFKDKDDQ